MAFDLDTASTHDIAQAIYIAYYGRAAEKAGFAYWSGEAQTLADAGASNIAVAVNFASRFADVAETRERYPFLADPDVTTSQQFVESIYAGLFGRSADPEGLAFYTARVVEQLEQGQPIGDIILDVLAGARDADLTVLENRIAAAQGYTDAHSLLELAYTSDDARTVVTRMDAETTATSARRAGIDRASDNLSEIGTAGDFFRLGNTSTFLGTEDNDFIAAIGTDVADGDRIDGGGGQDRFDWVFRDAGDGPATATITNVEWIFLTNEVPDTQLAFDATDWDGVTRLWNAASSSAIKVDGLSTLPALGLDNTTAATTVTLTGAAADTDTARLTLFASGAGSADSPAAVAIRSLEGEQDVVGHVAITAVADSVLDLVGVGGGVASVVIAGPGDLDARLDTSRLLEVDAATATGGVVLRLGTFSSDAVVTLNPGSTEGDRLVFDAPIGAMLRVRNFDPEDGDALDLSAIGVTELGDLTVTEVTDGLRIESAALDGSVVLVGLVQSDLEPGLLAA